MNIEEMFECTFDLVMLYPTAEAGWRIMTHLAMVLCRSCYKMLGHPAPHIHVLDRHSVFIQLFQTIGTLLFLSPI